MLSGRPPRLTNTSCDKSARWGAPPGGGFGFEPPGESAAWIDAGHRATLRPSQAVANRLGAVHLRGARDGTPSPSAQVGEHERPSAVPRASSRHPRRRSRLFRVDQFSPLRQASPSGARRPRRSLAGLLPSPRISNRSSNGDVPHSKTDGVPRSAAGEALAERADSGISDRERIASARRRLSPRPATSSPSRGPATPEEATAGPRSRRSSALLATSRWGPTARSTSPTTATTASARSPRTASSQPSREPAARLQRRRHPTTSAKLEFPAGVIVDGAGNVYLSDKQNDRIRRIDPLTGSSSRSPGMVCREARRRRPAPPHASTIRRARLRTGRIALHRRRRQ